MILSTRKNVITKFSKTFKNMMQDLLTEMKGIHYYSSANLPQVLLDYLAGLEKLGISFLVFHLFNYFLFHQLDRCYFLWKTLACQPHTSLLACTGLFSLENASQPDQFGTVFFRKCLICVMVSYGFISLVQTVGKSSFFLPLEQF